jgi:hypothetical protein
MVLLDMVLKRNGLDDSLDKIWKYNQSSNFNSVNGHTLPNLIGSKNTYFSYNFFRKVFSPFGKM